MPCRTELIDYCPKCKELIPLRYIRRDEIDQGTESSTEEPLQIAWYVGTNRFTDVQSPIGAARLFTVHLRYGMLLVNARF